MPLRLPRGFTLVEVMIVALLFLVVAGALLTTFLTGRTSYLSSDALVLVQQEARRAFDVMVRELREACPKDPDGAGQPLPDCTANVTPNVAGGDQLNFQVALSYTGGQIQWGNEWAQNSWIHYAVVDGDGSAATGNDRQLVRCLNNDQAGVVTGAGSCPGGFRVLANYVDVLSFAYASGVVTVNLSITYSNPALPTGRHGTGPTPLTTRVKLRNP